MLASLLYITLQRLLQLIALCFRSEEFKELEIVVLRHELDLFERQRGTTTLISTGPGDDGTAGGEFAGGTPDLTHVFFSTKTAMVSGDTDLCSGTPPGCYDIYDRRIAYATPRSASPIHVSSSGHR